MFRIIILAIVFFSIGCKTESNNPKKSLITSDTTVVKVQESPVKKVKLTGQDLLDSFAEEYYLHYPDNVNPNVRINVADEINPRKYYLKGDFVNALKYYNEQMIQYPNIQYVNFFAAMSAYNTGDYELAIQYFDRLQNRYPDGQYTIGSLFYEGLCYLRLGKVEQCKAQMADYLNQGGVMKGRVALLSQDLRLKWDKPAELQP